MRLVESPRDRLREVTVGLLADGTLPSVLLGAFLTSLIQLAVGLVPWAFPAVSGFLWTLSVLVYAVADELAQRWEDEKNRLLEPESRYYGIE